MQRDPWNRIESFLFPVNLGNPRILENVLNAEAVAQIMRAHLLDARRLARGSEAMADPLREVPSQAKRSRPSTRRGSSPKAPTEQSPQHARLGVV